MARKKLALLAIIALAAVVRIYGTIAFPFEQDELYTVDEATNLFHTRLLPGIQARPVFFFLEHPIITRLPHTPVVLRLLPLIFGIAGVFLTWVLARRVLGERAATVAALLAAVSPWHMYASGFGRYYSLLYALAAIIYWLLPEAYDSDRPRDYLAAFGALLVGAWTHPSFAFPVAGAALAVMLVGKDGTLRWRWPTPRGWTFLWLPFLGCSAVIYVLIRTTHTPSTIANGGERGLLATLRLVPAMVDWMTLTVFVAAVLGAATLIASTAPGRRRLGVMVLFGTVGMLAALFTLSFVTAIYADYGIAALPLVLVATAALVQWIEEAVVPGRQRVVGSAVVTVILVGVFPSALSYMSDGTRFDYRPAFNQIARENPAVAVLSRPVVLQRAYAPKLRGYELPTRRAKLDSLLSREQRLWAVVSVKRYGIVGDDTHELADWLAAHCRQEWAYQRPRLDYRIYRVDLWRCSTGM